jgi:ubiquinone/menaquinone biosynthesis C-methylase UbiE
MNDKISSGVNDKVSLTTQAEWDNVWQHHCGAYQGDIRHAYYIVAVRRRQERRLLEIAAGSFRDMGALNSWGIFCEGLDYSTESVEMAQSRLPVLTERIKKMDAFSLDYPDNSFDLTFHNGFWGYFDDDQISMLGAEQKRVSSSRMIATVHNAHNTSFKEKFTVWAEKDALYRIRFFNTDEIVSLMLRFCRYASVIPVGGGLVDKLIQRGIGPNAIRWMYQLRGCFRRRLEESERLMCIGEADR